MKLQGASPIVPCKRLTCLEIGGDEDLSTPGWIPTTSNILDLSQDEAAGCKFSHGRVQPSADKAVALVWDSGSLHP